MKIVRGYLRAMLVSVALTVFGLGSVGAIEVGQTLELGSVKKLDGTVFSLAQNSNKNTLIQIWASWCPFCKRQNTY